MPRKLYLILAMLIKNEALILVVIHLFLSRLIMLRERNAFTVVDLDPYGSPIPFLDSAVQVSW